MHFNHFLRIDTIHTTSADFINMLKVLSALKLIVALVPIHASDLRLKLGGTQTFIGGLLGPTLNIGG